MLSTLLRERPGVTAILDWEVESESTARPCMRVLIRVSPEPPARAGQMAEGVEVRSADNRTFRLLSARTVAGPPTHENCLVQAALDTTYEENLVAGYRRRLWLVLGAGLPAELSVLAATFNEMLDRLEDAFSRLSRFSSDIAHELRTPIHNLRGEVEVALGRARSPEEYREVLASSLEECQRLSRMIDNLLFLARAENPETQIVREPVDVSRELRAVRKFYEAAASEASVCLAVAAPEALTVDLDRTLFQRSVGNLIENSLTHTPRGGAINLSAAVEDGNVLVSVSDTGCGIPAEDLPRVCDRFHRVDRARSKHTGGVGLGLAIVKSIATLHGGTLRIDSELGRVTRVTLSFPQ